MSNLQKAVQNEKSLSHVSKVLLTASITGLKHCLSYRGGQEGLVPDAAEDAHPDGP